jgi:periplasmic protein CpxP/Spy
MKKIVLLVILSFIIISVNSIAQSRFTPQERLKNLKERLNLTEDQSAKVEKILTKSDAAVKSLRASDNPDWNEMKKLREDSNQQIMSILNDSQKAVFTKMQEERKNRWQKNSNNKEQKSN